MKATIRAADLFCGAGGASNGLVRACELAGRRLDLLAVNHWQTAVETHSANHPAARHLCEDLESVNPRKAVPGGRLDLLMAGPECTHHSTARGGKPVNDQSRASAWCILRWATALTIDTILIENVREFQTWGPIGSNGRPLKSRKGETFHAFIDALKSLGYRVDSRVLNAADYGDPTTRERLFIQARRGRRPISWPEPTHSPKGGEDLYGSMKPWRPAREVIDWKITGESIFRRKRPLSPNTLARIAAGLKKFGGAAAEPFLVLLRGTAATQVPYTTRSVDEPVPTIAANGQHVGLCQPFLVPANYGERPGQAPRCHSLDAPMPTVVGSVTHGLVEPFIVPQFGEATPRSIDRPLGTITTTSRGIGLVQPFILPPEGVHRGNVARSVDDPIQTVLASRGGGHLVEPFIISMEHSGANGKQVRSVDSPLATVTTRGDLRLVEPFVIPTNHGGTKDGAGRAYPIDRPMPTITTVDAWGLIEPFLAKYHGSGNGAHPVSDPLPTVDCKDRYGLVTAAGDGLCLDIRFRMLQPHELAAAHSFPADYHFAGNREQRVKQIGNSWPNALSEALCLALLEG